MAVIKGMQGSPSGKDLDRDDKVLATAKHSVGDGGTEFGSSTTGSSTTGSYTIDQGITKVTARSSRPSTSRSSPSPSSGASAPSCRPTPRWTSSI